MKRISLLLLGFLLISISFMKVEAKIFTVEEVITKFNELTGDKEVEGSKVVGQIDKDNKKVKFTWNNKDMLVNYGNDYLEFDSNGRVPTDAATVENEYCYLLFHYLLDTVLNLSDLDKYYTIPLLTNYNNDYDKYGVKLVYTPYKYTVSNADGSNVEKDNTYISNFKISFDSDKISAFASAYGKETDAKKYGNLVPKLSMYVYEGMPYYKLSLDYTPKDEDDKPYCKVYRSEAIDGNYVKVGAEDWSIGCNDFTNGVAFGDDKATAGKVYYYKAQVTGSDKFSSILKVDLTSNIVTDTSNNEIIYAPSKDEVTEDKKPDTEDKKEEPKKDYKNPETGAFLPALPILILVLVSGGVWSKVKNKFVRI